MRLCLCLCDLVQVFFGLCLSPWVSVYMYGSCCSSFFPLEHIAAFPKIQQHQEITCTNTHTHTSIVSIRNSSAPWIGWYFRENISVVVSFSLFVRPFGFVAASSLFICRICFCAYCCARPIPFLLKVSSSSSSITSTSTSTTSLPFKWQWAWKQKKIFKNSLTHRNTDSFLRSHIGQSDWAEVIARILRAVLLTLLQ